MNENLKKGGLIALIVIAVAAAVFSASKMFQGEKMESVRTISAPAGFKSEKESALEAQKNGGGSANPAPFQERDLAGDFRNGGGGGGGGGKEGR